MATVTVRIDLPEQLAREAEERGLLAPEALSAVLREALRQGRARSFFATADQLADGGEPAMTEQEVQAEIDAVRTRRRGSDADRR